MPVDTTTPLIETQAAPNDIRALDERVYEDSASRSAIADVGLVHEKAPDGWKRFERAVDATVKSGPKHRLAKAGKTPFSNAQR